MKKRIVFCAFMVMLALSAVAQSEHIQDLIQKAEAGNPHVQVNLATMYTLGLQVKKDYAEALKWYQKAADQGYAKGYKGLGKMYFEALGCEQDIPKALEYLNKAGEAGESDAYMGLGNYFREGILVEKDFEKAFQYYKKAAEGGLKDAQYMVGSMCFHGEGTKKDAQQALLWSEKAAKAGHAKAQSQLAAIYMNSEDEAEYKKAFVWNQKANEANDPKGARQLAMQYFFGLGVSKNTAKGLELFERAARLKDLKAMSYLGYFAMTGQGMAKDRERARQWLNKALAIDPTFKEAETFLFALDHNLDADSPDQSQELMPNRQQEKNDIYAVVIGNEQYKNEAEVRFAENDATAFKDYLVNTLGVDEKSQLKFILNAGLNDMFIALDWLENAIKANDGQARAMFYYAGHGIPNESDRSAYLLPVDGIGTMPRSALSLKEFYESMGRLNARSVTVFLDACFSGSKREDGMLASARGVAIKAKQDDPQGKMVVFSAAQGDETAYPLDEQKHGLFTYYLLKKLQDSGGSVTYGELSDYLKDEVSRQSFKANGKIQTPTAHSAAGLGDSWRQMKLK